MKIVPLYRYENIFLVGLESDYQDEKISDGLVVEIDIKSKKIKAIWSGQKMLKFGFYYSIDRNEREPFYDLIKCELGEERINEIEKMLLNPSQEAINSLIWVPERLKKIQK